MLYMSLVEMGTVAAATGHYSSMSYRLAQEFQVQQQQLAQRLADLRANPPATLSPQQLAEWERLTKRSGQAALDAANHLESLKGVRTLFGAKGDEMTSGLLEQISQSKLTAEEIAGLFQLKNDVEARKLAEQRQAVVKAFVGTLQQALQKYDLTAKAISEAKQAGQPATPEQKQQLLQFTAAILQGSDAVKTQLDALGSDNETVTALLVELKKLTDELEVNQVTIGKGTDVPVIADLEAKYQALFERIKQLTTTPMEPPVEPFTARITNVGIGNIDLQSAVLTWTGGKAFAKYSILYAADGEGELTQTVTSPQLALKNLKPGRNYTYKIVGYSETGEVLDTYGSATFSTPARTLPPPENLAYTVQTDGSVRITWTKNSLHQSFKLTYKTASGEERTMYPSANSATLTGLALDQTYAYTITAFGTPGNENLVSQEVDGDFNYGTVCDARITASALRILEGESVTLSVNGCMDKNNSPSSVVWKVNGQPIGSFISQTFTPTETTVYSATCLLTDSKGQPSSCSDSKQIIVDKKCTDITLSASPVSVHYGESILLNSTGCQNSSWYIDYPNSTLGQGSHLLYTPKYTANYTLKCMKPDGSVCFAKTNTVETNIDCNEFKINMVGNKVPESLNPGTYKYQASGCPINVAWSVSKDLNYYISVQDPNTIYIYYRKKHLPFTITANCGIQCSKQVEAKDTKCDLKSFGSLNIIAHSVEPLNTVRNQIITIKSTQPTKFFWPDNNSYSEVRVVPTPKSKAAIYTYTPIYKNKECDPISVVIKPDNTNANEPLLDCIDLSLSISPSSTYNTHTGNQDFYFIPTGCTDGFNQGYVLG